MTGTDETAGQGLQMLAAVASVASDPHGIDTFARYVWQAKQAVRQWLTCLQLADGPAFLVCEHVEDVALVYTDRIRFVQLKTRDRGSWSASAMCDRGLDALVRSYTAARNAGLHEISTFELWFEGPISDRADTEAFVHVPASASSTIKTKIVKLGLRRGWLPDFLQRLVIAPNQPTRSDIDAKAIWELSALWPGLTRPELAQTYERLLDMVVSAQAAAAAPASIQAHLAVARPFVGRDLPEPHDPGGAAFNAIRNQVLSHATLVALTPPQPGASVEQLLARISAGDAASLLELKMTSAGASSETIHRTQGMRADMEVERQLLLASRANAEADLERLADRLLNVAHATAVKVAMLAGSNPAAAGRPAEVIAADLLSRPSDLAICDRQGLFDRDSQLIFGYLGHLSDVCRFGWRAA
ncbi:dsDNA nuclease domain-containing protein [Dactylosporangium sp. NPDC051485]|uniref:dsDNA nuclease domain-containing protein n=1 Tax=Dactylosporangium sp. NPDC051485 TaxID=3154846 RepID=UPI00343EE151